MIIFVHWHPRTAQQTDVLHIFAASFARSEIDCNALAHEYGWRVDLTGWRAMPFRLERAS